MPIVNKMRAQGLPFNVIVIAIIAFFVLVLVLVWSGGVFGKLSLRTGEVSEVTETKIAAAQSKCSKLCIQAQSISDPSKWNQTAYCKHKEVADWDGNGNVTDKGGDEGLGRPCNPDGDDYRCCWEDPINQFCTVEIGGKTCTQDNCETGC